MHCRFLSEAPATAVRPRWAIQVMVNPTRTRGELLHAAFTVAQQFRDYGTYGDEKKARKAIARKCTGFSDVQYASALAKALGLYDHCIKIMDRDGATYAETADLNLGTGGFFGIDWSPLIKELRKGQSGFLDKTYRSALSWALCNHYLR